MVKILMNDGAHVVALNRGKEDRNATLIVKKREMYGDLPGDYEDTQVGILINKNEAKQILEGLQNFINSDD